MSTSITSFVNWLRFHLGKGEFEGQRLLSPGLIQELQKPRVHVVAPELAEYSDVHYGLGFRVHRCRGERVVWHGGGYTGTRTLMMMMPDRGVGVAVLANNGMAPLFAPHILANYVFDRMCDKEPAPWLDRFREERRQQGVDRQAEKPRLMAMILNAVPRNPGLLVTAGAIGGLIGLNQPRSTHPILFPA